jgi:hypothetical protein
MNRPLRFFAFASIDRERGVTVYQYKIIEK